MFISLHTFLKHELFIEVIAESVFNYVGKLY